MKELSESEALHKAAAYCSLAERCISDVYKKLTLWNIEKDVQARIIKRLQDEKFLDEERFCTAFVNDKSKFAKWGQNKIKFELQKKNIPESMIVSCLENINKDENKERLLSLIAAKKKSVKGKDKFEIEQKLMRFATGKGYLFDDIYWAITKLKNKS